MQPPRLFPAAAPQNFDFWKSRFAPAVEHDAGAGRAMYRQCLLCGGQALEGALSAHARWCDATRPKKTLTLAAFDSLESAARRPVADQRAQVRQEASHRL